MQLRLPFIVLPLVALLSVAAAVKDRFTGDLFVARAVQSIRAGSWEEVMEGVSFVGQTPFLVTIAAVFMALFLWRKQPGACVAIAAAVLSFGIGPVLKFIVDRPRPSEDLVTVWRSQDSLSFPSGHAFTAVLLFGLLFYLAPRLVPWRWAALLMRVSSASLILLIGISRVYLGAHWPSDVLGGLVYGGLILAFLIYAHRLYSAQNVPLTQASPA